LVQTAVEKMDAVQAKRADVTSGSERESWGRYPRVRHSRIREVYWTDQLPEALRHESSGSALAYGLGRSYGDSCLNEGRALLDCSHLDRILHFDPEQGLIRCEAGTSLKDILEIAVPHGWFLPVTPGTKFVTLGGAIANDVHGKNHHRAGTFGCHVRQLAIYRTDAGWVICGPEENKDLFQATVGGLGLTGIIAWAEFQLRPIQGTLIDMETIPFHSLEEFVSLSDESDSRFEYTVAWVDCLSGERTRGIFMRGNHANAPERTWQVKAGPKVPFAPPDWVLNHLTVKLFNTAYYWRNSHKPRQSVASSDSFFYPLDSVDRWNLIYGKSGFLQYQCVIPEASFGSLQTLLTTISASGMGSFLGVLKRFGSVASPGMLSFPRPGYTLALDFAMRGEKTLTLMSALDRIVAGAGGAFYPAKDARMSAEMFELSYPAWRDFVHFIDPALSSSFWRRVTGGR
jgi:FAD/FMN-containing dehydrogenase